MDGLYYSNSNGEVFWPGEKRRAVRQPPPTPKPIAPVGQELLTGYATTHRVRVVSSGVKFKTREDLMTGLDYLAGRVGSASENETLRQIGEASGGPAVAMYMTVLPRRGDWYEQNIRRHVEAYVIDDSPIVETKIMFSDDWEYDGSGVWHKASLKVWVDPNGFYLHYHAAYVGNKPEVDMAKALPEIATLNVLRYEHRLTYETHGDRWAIPLNDLRYIYSTVFRIFDADAFLKELTNPIQPEHKSGRWADVVGPVIVNPSALGIRCTVSLGCNGLWVSKHDRGEDNKPLAHHAYLIEDDCLTGPSREQENDFIEDWRRPIDLTVYISPLEEYNADQIDSAGKSSDILTNNLQSLQKRPNPYPNE